MSDKTSLIDRVAWWSFLLLLSAWAITTAWKLVEPLIPIVLLIGAGVIAVALLLHRRSYW